MSESQERIEGIKYQKLNWNFFFIIIIEKNMYKARRKCIYHMILITNNLRINLSLSWSGRV